MKTVAVFFGGASNEHEISVITGMLAVNLLRSTLRVLPVYLPLGGGMRLCEGARGVEDFRKGQSERFPPVVFTEGGLAYAKKPKKKIGVDCALNCCHGGAGEDGTLSSLLVWHGIRSASPPAAPSAVFMDKRLTKIAAKGLGVRVARSFALSEEEWRNDADLSGRMREFGYPAVIKPCKLGSSIGISVVANDEELERALDLAFRLDDCVLVEEYLKNKRDLNCAAYRRGDEVLLSPVEEVFSDENFLTFGEKYEGTGTRRSRIPAGIPQETAEEIRSVLEQLYRTFGLFGVVRADFLLADGTVYFNELNTVPGSLACYLFGESLTESRAFLLALLEEAEEYEPPKKETVTTGILDSQIFAGGKACKRR